MATQTQIRNQAHIERAIYHVTTLRNVYRDCADSAISAAMGTSDAFDARADRLDRSIVLLFRAWGRLDAS
jgi:hypothetical protein